MGAPLKVLLLENIHQVAEQQLRAGGFDVTRFDGAIKEDELVKRLAWFGGVQGSTVCTVARGFMG